MKVSISIGSSKNSTILATLLRTDLIRIKSVRSRVANIVEFLDEPIDIDTFKEIILKTIFGETNQVEEYKLTDEDWANIEPFRLDFCWVYS